MGKIENKIKRWQAQARKDYKFYSYMSTKWLVIGIIFLLGGTLYHAIVLRNYKWGIISYAIGLVVYIWAVRKSWHYRKKRFEACYDLLDKIQSLEGKQWKD